MPAKNKIVPLPANELENKIETLPTIPENKALKNNYVSSPKKAALAEIGEIYFFLPGHALAYISRDPQSPKKNGLTLFQKINNGITQRDDKIGFIPNANITYTEEDAFKTAKKLYPQHAVTIFKLNISLNELNVDFIRTKNKDSHQKFLSVVRPDLNKYLVSMKSVSTKTDTVESVANANYFKKLPGGRFEEVLPQADKMDSPPSKTRKP